MNLDGKKTPSVNESERIQYVAHGNQSADYNLLSPTRVANLIARMLVPIASALLFLLGSSCQFLSNKPITKTNVMSRT